MESQELSTGTEEKLRQQEFTRLLLESREGNAHARETLIEQNLGLVWTVVRRFLHRGYEAEDLFQIGSIGLIKAIDRFSIGYQVQFSTYAVPMISGEIRRFLRDDGVIKVSRSIKENGWKIAKAKEQLAKQGIQDVTLAQLAKATGLNKEEVLLALDAPMEIDSLNRPQGMEENNASYSGSTLQDTIWDPRDEETQVDNRVLLEQLFAGLEPKERQVLYLRYFRDCTQSAVASQLSMTQVQVSRMEKRLLQVLRKSFTE